MRSEHCNNTLYQFFKAKALNLEVKLRHREEELNAAEVRIADRDKDILELKNRLKGKDHLGAEKEKLRVDIALVLSELDKARKDASSSKVVDIRELAWLRDERTRQASRIKELVEKIKKEANKWNARADEHNKFMAHYRQQRQLAVDMQNRYNADRQQFNETLERTPKGLYEARESISRLETKVVNLEEELRQDRSSLDPEVQDYIQRFFRERDEARAETYALNNALVASRADIACLVDSEKSLEINMYSLNKGIEDMNNEVNHLRHLDSMKQVELDECQFSLTNVQLDYKKISYEYDFLDDARDAVVNEYEIASSNVEELEGHLSLANERLEKAQSDLVHQQGQTSI
ncbi:golgin subfamily A member 6-like protein 6 [Papaver somniferum]|uniref:golgin subfamily A member 6-like protein 6 n=1 Tax=Papaver somniferum TaxID=3469 RepID=UPI000E7011D5|nr:golgin subfamily A member 6-like protein 6 [Papaver somniferum]